MLPSWTQWRAHLTCESQARLQADFGSRAAAGRSRGGRRVERRYLDLSLHPLSNRAADDQPAMFYARKETCYE
jgi:hypothetical protein